MTEQMNQDLEQQSQENSQQVNQNEHDDNQGPMRLAKGIYLLPNLFTTAALFSGFYSVIASMKGLYVYAAVTIFIAMVADALDGRVARLTNTASAFGAQYDSISDMLSFGVAPAVLAYSWSLHSFGKIGWLIAFFYTAATGLRLARFNVHVDDEVQEKKYFFGLPCPAAAAVVASSVWMGTINGLNSALGHVLLAVMTLFVAIMMVTTVKYLSFKDLNLKGKVPFVAILIVVLLFVAIALDPPPVLFAGFLVFALTGPVMALKGGVKLRKKK
jgi:CDP-diacylglycerol--serine O-phosphatidyltransferase